MAFSSLLKGILQPGHLTNLVLNKVIEEKLPLPYNDCLSKDDIVASETSDLYQDTVRAKGEYRQTNCYDLCLKKYISKKCQCSWKTKSCRSIKFLILNWTKESSFQLKN